MSDDLISRRVAIDAIRASTSKYTGFMEMEMYTDDDAVEAIKGVPSIDAVQVKHGIWMEENPRPRSSQFYCSVCHRTAYDTQPTRIDGWVKRCRYAYCPNCGARMDGEENG